MVRFAMAHRGVFLTRNSTCEPPHHTSKLGDEQDGELMRLRPREILPSRPFFHAPRTVLTN